MERYVLWFARLERFYQILVAGALFIGIAAFGTGLATENPIFLVLAILWILVAPAIVWLSSSYEGN